MAPYRVGAEAVPAGTCCRCCQGISSLPLPARLRGCSRLLEQGRLVQELAWANMSLGFEKRVEKGLVHEGCPWQFLPLPRAGC